MQSHSSILCKAVFVAQPALWPSSVSPARRFSEPHRDFPHHVILTTETGNTVLDCTWTVLGHLGCLILSCWGMSKCGCSIKRHAQSPIANLYCPPDNPAVHGMNVSRIRFPNKIIDLAIYQMWLRHTQTISYPEMPCQMHIPIPSIQIDWVGHCKVQSRVWLTFGCLGANPALRLRNFEKSWADLSVRTATLTISWGIDQTNYTEIHWLLQDPEQLPA